MGDKQENPPIVEDLAIGAFQCSMFNVQWFNLILDGVTLIEYLLIIFYLLP